MSHRLANKLKINGYCMVCHSSCSVSIPGVPKEGDVLFEAVCETHGGEEIQALPDYVAEEARKESAMLREVTICCFEV